MKIDAVGRPWALFCTLALIVVSLPLGGAAVANHADRTLNLVPENKNNPVGGRHNMTAILSSAPGSQPITVHFEVTGPGDPGPIGPGSGNPGSVNSPDGNTPEAPDRTCVIDVGALECQVFYKSEVEGADQIRGWIDHDPLAVEADMSEGPDEGLVPGATAEKDNTDVIMTRWFFDLPPGANLTCVSDSVSEPQDKENTATCTLQNSVGTKFEGWVIDAENLDGANDPDDSRAFDDGGDPGAHGADYDDACTTGTNGRCTIDIPATAKKEAGTAEVCFWVDEDEDSSFHMTPKQDGGLCDDAEPAPGEDQGNHNTTAFAEVAWFQTLDDSAVLHCVADEDSRPSAGPRRIHTVTCTLTDNDGPVDGVRIDAENLDGANDPDSMSSSPPDYDDACTTEQGQCELRIAIPDPGVDGSAPVCIWADENIDNGFDASGGRWDGGDCDIDNPETTYVVDLEWAPTPRSVSLAASTTTTTSGRSVTLSGIVDSTATDCEGGVPVDIEWRDNTGDLKSLETVTEANGTYSKVVEPRVSASYHAKLSGAKDCVDTESEADPLVEVHKKLTLKSMRKSVRPGRKVRLRAKVLRCKPDRPDKVVLLKVVNGGFKRRGRATTNDNCVAVFRQRINKRSVFRAHSPDDVDQLAGTSRRVTVRLK